MKRLIRRSNVAQESAAKQQVSTSSLDFKVRSFVYYFPLWKVRTIFGFTIKLSVSVLSKSMVLSFGKDVHFADND